MCIRKMCTRRPARERGADGGGLVLEGQCGGLLMPTRSHGDFRGVLDTRGHRRAVVSAAVGTKAFGPQTFRATPRAGPGRDVVPARMHAGTRGRAPVCPARHLVLLGNIPGRGRRRGYSHATSTGGAGRRLVRSHAIRSHEARSYEVRLPEEWGRVHPGPFGPGTSQGGSSRRRHRHAPGCVPPRGRA